MEGYMKRIAILLLCITFSASATAGLKEGQAAFNKKDYKTAIKEWEPLARQGNVYAQRMMGMFYLLGLKVEQDDKKAFFWYYKAAKQGDADSEAHVGAAYQYGDGVAQNDDLAIQWYRKAAAQGNDIAKSNLAMMQSAITSAKCRKTASTKLFNTLLRCATRNEFRGAVKSAGNKVEREDSKFWVDRYKSSAVLEGSKELLVGYTTDGKFATAQYTIPANMDASKIVKVKDMVASKYGKPHSSTGNPDVGEMEYKWTLRDGIQIDLWRGWPDTTVYLSYNEPENYAVMQNEINKEKGARQKARQARQNSAF